MKKNNNFFKLNSVMASVVKNLNIDRGLREVTLKNMWGEIVGSRFSNTSKVICVKKQGLNDVLFIAVKSSGYAQELMFFKNDILKKLSPIALSLQFNIKDIIFDTKIWNESSLIKEENAKEEELIKFIDKEPTKEELERINVDKEIELNILNSIQSQNFSSEEAKKKVFNAIIKDIKTRIWQKNNGFPLCKKCGIPLKYFYVNKDTYCPSCRSN